MSIPLPICALCNKSVDRVVMDRNHEKQVNVYKAECHGKFEILELDDFDIEETISIEPGTAFNTKLIEETK